jgi:TolA-binding protein
MARFERFAILAAAWMALLGTRTVRAQSAKAAAPADLQSEIDQLKRKVDALEAANAQLQRLDQQVRIVDRKLELQQTSAREEKLRRPCSYCPESE